ncbi:hypothetical protein, partial [Celeribacter sp. PS-C1]|uniref:hypothetical protein n=1 Tax=Celeribacter sp. PS-C1 TaxID=2820813 RepID=UPI001CA5BA26
RPNRVANDRAWETETFKARKIRQIQHGIALQRQVDGNNLTMPVELIGLEPATAFCDATVRDSVSRTIIGNKPSSPATGAIAAT